MADFNDHFSADAAQYATFRPTYPPALFTWLAAHTARHDLAWDCATGNGQAARGIAEHYSRVVATDASASQLDTRPRTLVSIPHGCRGTERSPDSSVDLVTVAQALHWLPLERFFPEAQRVVARDGLLAVWGYSRPRVSSAALDEELRRFHDEIVGPYWPPERKLVDTHYREVSFASPKSRCHLSR